MPLKPVYKEVPPPVLSITSIKTRNLKKRSFSRLVLFVCARVCVCVCERVFAHIPDWG